MCNQSVSHVIAFNVESSSVLLHEVDPAGTLTRTIEDVRTGLWYGQAELIENTDLPSVVRLWYKDFDYGAPDAPVAILHHIYSIVDNDDGKMYSFQLDSSCARSETNALIKTIGVSSYGSRVYINIGRYVDVDVDLLVCRDNDEKIVYMEFCPIPF